MKENNAGETEGATGSESYQDEIYDIALFQAIMKAENYLKPFFTYDLDEIYSIEWDGEADGGKDGDKTTLSADQEDAAAEYCYGVSEYLPYGSYVTVEQQPAEKDLDDFYNKHYKIDEPKEIELPAVYEGGKAGADTTPEQLSNHYKYKESEPVAKLTAKYYIRFNEEWPEVGTENNYVIKAHGYYGDYEIYKYGLDLDKLDGTAAGDPTGAAHFQITQSPMDPTKDYYNTIVDPEEQGGNPDSYYFADDGNTGQQPTVNNMKPMRWNGSITMALFQRTNKFIITFLTQQRRERSIKIILQSWRGCRLRMTENMLLCWFPGL
ncbi:MAG: hypothetical protein ACLRL6_02495 [Clostridium sp.]